ncbi:MAG: carbohydrate ABC transporter permease [Anaerolineae bacterium]
MTRAERWVPYLFVMPALLLLLAFRLVPAAAGFAESLYRTGAGGSAARTFVGLANFARIFRDPVFWKSLTVTLLFSMVINPVQTGMALVLALLVNQRLRGVQLFRSVMLLPMVVSLNVGALVWGLMLDKNAGLVNGALVTLGLPRQPFLTSENQALWSIVLILAWTGAAYWMVYILAGLQEIPETLYEAASMDGAGRWQGFIYVTLPLLRRILTFVLVSDTIINFFIFAPVFMLTRGGPQLSTNLVMYDAYRRGFIWGDFSASAVMAFLLFLVAAVVVAVEFRFLRGAGGEA